MRTDILKWLILVFLFISPARGWQAPTEHHFSGNDYDRVVEILFPVPAPWSPTACSYHLVLRFLPTGLPESQVFICFKGKEGFHVNLRYVGDHERNIYEQMLDMERLTGARKPEEFAGNIRVISQDVKMSPARMRRLMTDYESLRLSPAFNTVMERKGETYEIVQPDGTRFELWCEFPSNRVHFSLAGSLEGKSPKDHPLIRWMTRVRSEVWMSHMKRGD